MLRKFLTASLFLVLISFMHARAQDIHDLIQPLRLTAGETDSILISDIFYSEDYDLTFQNNELIKTEYLPESKVVVFTPAENFKGLSLIKFSLNKKEYAIPAAAEQKFKYTFNFKPEDKPTKVNLFGSFNGWNRESEPMNDNDSDGIYTTTILIEPGRYEYKFFVDGKELFDKANPEMVPNGMGDFNSILTIKSPDTSKTFLHKLDYTIKGDMVVLTFALSSMNKNNDINKTDAIVLLDNTVADENFITTSREKLILTLPLSELSGYKTIRVAFNRDGVTSNIQSIFLNNGKPVTADDITLHQSKIIYSLMIDRFYDGDKTNTKPVDHPEVSPKANYMGGDIAGVIEKLNSGYFDALGINTLWVSPVIQNTDSAYQEYPAPHRWYTGYHGYWPTHPTNVEERFGDMNLLKKLVSEAHTKNIKVLLDYVAHHVHIEHPYWNEHRDWFGILDLPDGRKNLRLWDEHRLTTWFEPYLPSFDFVSSPDALIAMTDNAMWWLKETGIDGFRHDAVKHVPNEFWRLLTRKIKSEIEVPRKESLYQIGETFGSYDLISSYVNNGQLSAQFNFSLYDTAIPVFLDEKLSFSALDDQMKKTFSVYGVNHTMGNIMDSHDKVRYMAYADGDVSLSGGDPTEIGWNNPPVADRGLSYEKLKVHLAYLLTIPGIPVIYYGDEFGMSGSSDPDNRRMMRFGKELTPMETKTLDDVKKIVNLRNDHTALKYGDFLTLKAEGSIYAFLRSDFNERVLVILNKGTKTLQAKLDMPSVYTSNGAVDLNTGEKYLINNNTLHVNLPAAGYKIFKIN